MLVQPVKVTLGSFSCHFDSRICQGESSSCLVRDWLPLQLYFWADLHAAAAEKCDGASLFLMCHSPGHKAHSVLQQREFKGRKGHRRDERAPEIRGRSYTHAGAATASTRGQPTQSNQVEKWLGLCQTDVGVHTWPIGPH